MTDMSYIDFTGGLNLKDTRTILGKSAKKVYYSENTYNVRPYKTYGVTRQKGNEDVLLGLHTTPILAIGAGKAISGEYICIACNDGTFKEVDVSAGTTTTLLTGLSTTAKGKFERLKEYLLYSNGVDEPFYYAKDRVTATTGTSTINGTVDVVGSGTLYTQELLVGDAIIINGETKIVDTLTDNTNLIVRSAFTSSSSGEVLTRTRISYLNCTSSTGTIIRSKVMTYYNNRIFFGQENILYWCALGLFSEWDTSDDLGAGFYGNLDSNITTLEAYRNNLLIHITNDQTYYMTGDTRLATDFTFNLFFDKSSKSPFGVLNADNKQYFFDNGIFTVSQTGELNQIKLTDEISKDINNEDTGFLADDFDYVREDEIFSIHNKVKREIWFYFPIKFVSNFSTVYIYDYNNKIWFKRIEPQALTDAVWYENNVYSSTTDGKVLKEDVKETFNAAVIPWTFETQYFNFKKKQSKDIDELWLDMDSIINNSFNYSCKFNYSEDSKSADIPISVAGTNMVWGIDNWGEKRWATSIEVSQFAYIYNNQRSIRLCFVGSEIYHSIALISLHFRGIQVNEL